MAPRPSMMQSFDSLDPENYLLYQPSPAPPVILGTSILPIIQIQWVGADLHHANPTGLQVPQKGIGVTAPQEFDLSSSFAFH
jgi:hypothetical protein